MTHPTSERPGYRKLLRRIERRLLPLGLGRWRLPQFMVIGAQKAGTTWLHQNLAAHPEIFVPGMKELHYFDSDLERTLFGYARYFTRAQQQVIGETTPAYSVLPDADVRFIKDLLPGLKIVLMMRDPRERAWSQAVMEVVTRPGRRLEDVPLEDFEQFIESPACFDRGDYPSILARWESVFGENAVCTGFFEEMQDNPEALLNTIFEHVGVSRVDDWALFPVRTVVAPVIDKDEMKRKRVDGGFAVDDKTASARLEMPGSVRRILDDLYAGVIARMRTRFGDRMPDWD